MGSFVHFMLLSLVLSGVGTLNKLIPLSFLEVLDLGKAQFSADIITLFLEIIKLQITDETLPRCLFTIFMQVRKSGP